MGSCIVGQIYCKGCFKMGPKTLQGKKKRSVLPKNREKRGRDASHICMQDPCSTRVEFLMELGNMRMNAWGTRPELLTTEPL